MQTLYNLTLLQNLFQPSLANPAASWVDHRTLPEHKHASVRGCEELARAGARNMENISVVDRLHAEADTIAMPEESRCGRDSPFTWRATPDRSIRRDLRCVKSRWWRRNG